MTARGSRWLDLIETRLGDAALKRGADYAAFDFQLDVEIQPGHASTQASSGPRMHYTATIEVPTLSADQIDTIVESIGLDTGRTAAVLDGDLPDDLGLLDLDPASLTASCTCTFPDAGCKHVGALAHLVADAITDDPFDLLHLRGLDREALIGRLAARRRAELDADSGEERTEPTDVDDADSATAEESDEDRLVWSAGDGPLPTDRPLPAEPGRLPPFPTPPPASASFTEAGLRMLADDSARRAHQLLADGTASWRGLDSTTDVVRRAADLEDGPEWKGLVERVDTTSQELRARVEAWRVGGPDAVEAQIAPAETVSDPDDRDVQWRRTHAGTWVRFAKQKGRWIATATETDGPTHTDHD